MEDMERIWLSKLNQVSKRSLAKLLKNVHEVVETVPTKSLAQTNQLIYAAAYFTTQKLDLNIGKNKAIKKRKPKCKICLKIKNKVNNKEDSIGLK